MTFLEVINLGISPEGVSREYSSKRFKGGMGTLIEERYFGYKANKDALPDFPEAGVELKSTCFDIKQDGNPSAGERLVLTMIPFDKPIEDDYYNSHLRLKSTNILLVIYERDKSSDNYSQQIKNVQLFSPPEEDLKIIINDYNKIRDLIQAGRAEELSEGLTNYLGACTKGATEASMWTEQYYPPHTKAKRRAFCFKRQYMDYVLSHYILGEKDDTDSIIKDASDVNGQTFEQYVINKIARYNGKSARELCEIFNIEYTRNKAQWTTITYAILGVRGEKAEEFKKASISVRTVRTEKNGRIRENLSLNTFEFKELAEEEWEDSRLYKYFDETRFFFTVFQKRGEEEILAGSTFWNMPTSDIEGPVRHCWEQTRKAIVEGVVFEQRPSSNGKIIVYNNLPKESDNRVAHVRPHTAKRGYYFLDGSEIGDPEKYGSELPDGRWMTKQSFWLNCNYIKKIVEDSGLLDLD